MRTGITHPETAGTSHTCGGKEKDVLGGARAVARIQ